MLWSSEGARTGDECYDGFVQKKTGATMMGTSSRPVMTPEEFRLIKEYVAATYGLNLEDGREEALSLKLLPHIQQLRLSTFAEYYAYLKFGPGAGEELNIFISLLTNNATKRYFIKCSEGYQINEAVRGMTRFIQGNLLDLGSVLPEGGIDIIFCRNVLIYFGDETIKTIVENFARYLKADGFLFLGHSESLSRITNCYLPLCLPGAIIYRLKE